MYDNVADFVIKIKVPMKFNTVIGYFCFNTYLTCVFSLIVIVPGSTKMGGLLLTSTIEILTSTAAFSCWSPIPPSNAI